MVLETIRVSQAEDEWAESRLFRMALMTHTGKKIGKLLCKLHWRNGWGVKRSFFPFLGYLTSDTKDCQYINDFVLTFDNVFPLSRGTFEGMVCVLHTHASLSHIDIPLARDARCYDTPVVLGEHPAELTRLLESGISLPGRTWHTINMPNTPLRSCNHLCIAVMLFIWTYIRDRGDRHVFTKTTTCIG